MTPNNIIFYTRFDTLISYVLMIKRAYNMTSPLLYVNKIWSYGRIQHPLRHPIEDSLFNDSVLLFDDADQFKKEILDNFILDIQKTPIDVSGMMSDNWLGPELICQLPLNYAWFNRIYVKFEVMTGGSKYYKKYIKYKTKYLQLHGHN